MTVQEILHKLRDPVADRKGGYWAFCPCHPDGAKHNRRSLHITEKDNKVLIHCFAGCSYESIAAALGIKSAPEKHGKDTKKIIAVYKYIDEDGNLLFEVVRYEPKGFRQRRPDGRDGYIWNLKNTRRVLYRLPEVVEATKNKQTIFIVEGEKDADNLARLGLTATTAPGGAGKWLNSYSATLVYANVVILPDNDIPGQKHAEKIARELTVEAQAKVKIVNLPGLPEKGDVSDWLAAGHTKEELLELVEKTEYWSPEKDENDEIKETDSMPWLEISESGKSATFRPGILAQHIAKEILSVYCNGSFYIYRKGVYVQITDDEAEKIVKSYLPEYYVKSSWVNDAVNLWKLEVLRKPEELNQYPELLNLENGMLNWITGELIEHDPKYMSTIRIPVVYNPEATCPEIDKFLNDVIYPDCIPIIEEFAGYCLVPDTRFEKALMLTGSGANGKSTFIKLIIALIGKSNVSNIPLQELADNRFKRAELFGKLVNCFADLSTKEIENSSYFKTVVSGDEIDAERKHKDPFSFRPFARLIFSANEIPRARDKTYAYYRRWLIIPFPNQFDENKADKGLLARLTTPEELSGFLNKALAGLRRLFVNEQFSSSPTVESALDSYKTANDSIAAFVSDCCMLDPGMFVSKQSIYEAYKKYCADAGYGAVSNRKFYERLLGAYPAITERRPAGGARVFAGIGLIEPELS